MNSQKFSQKYFKCEKYFDRRNWEKFAVLHGNCLMISSKSYDMPHSQNNQNRRRIFFGSMIPLYTSLTSSKKQVWTDIENIFKL